VIRVLLLLACFAACGPTTTTTEPEPPIAFDPYFPIDCVGGECGGAGGEGGAP
jgi:hypothetical protein